MLTIPRPPAVHTRHLCYSWHMIAKHRTLNCDECAEWMDIEDTESAVQARKRARAKGWKTGPPLDLCPRDYQKKIVR